ncbi:hypothetical protein [Sporomusa aerivorans]|uniref:hypothetical protein n=1 Tax=Sporomusa aerivorans TaxID=204936 RepID=UPI00352B4CC7
MGEKDFQQDVIDRLARIETKQDTTMATVEDHSKTLVQHGKDIVATDARARSAHHRVDSIFLTAGIVGAVAGWVAEFVAKLFGKGGQ